MNFSSTVVAENQPLLDSVYFNFHVCNSKTNKDSHSTGYGAGLYYSVSYVGL